MSTTPEITGRRAHALLAVLLLAAFAVYARILAYPFINYDDIEYVLHNPAVNGGLTLKGLWEVFTTPYIASWFPLAMASHMVDVEIFGLRPGAHHGTSLLLHLANTALIFVLLRRLTDAPGRALAAAAIFALHPVNVEAVVWISARKDLLSTFLLLLMLLAYARYARGPSVAGYALVALLFTLGLFAKTMLIMIPFVLLAVDVWPLRRIAPEPAALWARRGLALEKAPLFLIACVFAALQYHFQLTGGAVRTLDAYPAALRIHNVFANYAHFLGTLAWPRGLALVYPPYGERLHIAQTLVNAGLLAGLTAAAYLLRRRAPYAAAGWAWFVLLLVPVSGIVQIGSHGAADRYLYLPMIGLVAAVVWGACALAEWLRIPGRAQAAGLCGVLAALAVVTVLQVRHWRSSEAIWARTLAVTQYNSSAEYNMGYVLYFLEDYAGAEAHFRRAIVMRPHDYEALTSLGLTLEKVGRRAEAEAQYRKSLQIAPGNGKANYHLGRVLLEEGRAEAAMPYLQRAVEAESRNALYHQRLGEALLAQGRDTDAAAHFAEAARLDPMLRGNPQGI